MDATLNGIYTVGHKKRATLFFNITAVFLVVFFTLYVPIENRNEHSTERI